MAAPVFVIARDRHQPQRLARHRQAADRRRGAGRRRRGEVPEAHAGDVRAPRPVEHRARHALGPHDVHRLPPQRRVRRRASTGRSTATAAERGILWFASCWDEESVDFIEQFNPPCYKAASASLTDHAAAREDEGDGPAADHVDRDVDHGGDRRGGRRGRARTTCSSRTRRRPIRARPSTSTCT